MLKEEGINAKINEMQDKALKFREKAEVHLLGSDPEKALQEDTCLFYPVEESEEFE